MRFAAQLAVMGGSDFANSPLRIIRGKASEKSDKRWTRSSMRQVRLVNLVEKCIPGI
jgi:hypothetical protein